MTSTISQELLTPLKCIIQIGEASIGIMKNKKSIKTQEEIQKNLDVIFNTAGLMEA